MEADKYAAYLLCNYTAFLLTAKSKPKVLQCKVLLVVNDNFNPLQPTRFIMAV